MENSTMPTEVAKKSKTFNYEVIFHLTDGKTITVEIKDEPYDKHTLADRICMSNFAILEGGNLNVNLRHVLYIEVKEEKKEDA